jgi:hypothetical protein
MKLTSIMNPDPRMEMRNLVHGYQPAPKVVAQAPVSPSLS